MDDEFDDDDGNKKKTQNSGTWNRETFVQKKMSTISVSSSS